MVRAFYKRIFLLYQAILSFIKEMLLFVADIHLRPDSKEDAEIFISWLSQAIKDADAVYILGDLFDYWYTGLQGRFQDVLDAMRSPKVSLITGNRDFLLRKGCLKDINILPDEETIITINGTKILLAHGHSLMDNDAGFKLFKRIGWPLLGHLDSWLPLTLKDRCAKALVKSSASTRMSSAQIREHIEKEKGVHTVVCGHLHKYFTRPGLIVLPAFCDSRAWLAWDNGGPHLCSLDTV
jgi:UDP-2,3-diacylglucosamine pyrophosphatase LpxH